VSPRKRPELIEGPDDVPGPLLGEKIEWLIRHRWPDGSVPPATNADVALSITAVTGEELSSTGIWKLRTGRGDNPTLKTMTALATFFSVPLGFFGEDEDAAVLGDQAALAALLREKGVSRESLRALTDLSPAGRRMVEEMIESVARMEREPTETRGSRVLPLSGTPTGRSAAGTLDRMFQRADATNKWSDEGRCHDRSLPGRVIRGLEQCFPPVSTSASRCATSMKQPRTPILGPRCGMIVRPDAEVSRFKQEEDNGRFYGLGGRGSRRLRLLATYPVRGQDGDP
jgi:hypothetical protein